MAQKRSQLKFLCDTNIALQILRKREFHAECIAFFDRHLSETAMTDFSFFSLLLRAENFGMEETAYQFVLEVLEKGLKIVKTENSLALKALITKKITGLDFDDQIQYLTAQKLRLSLITLDHDFLNAELDIPVFKPGEVE